MKIHTNKSYEAEKTFSHDQNKKTKMRIYFISSFDLLFKGIYPCEHFANTDFTNAVLQ